MVNVLVAKELTKTKRESKPPKFGAKMPFFTEAIISSGAEFPANIKVLVILGIGK